MTGFFGDKFDIPVAVDLAGGETRRIGLPAVTRKGVWRIAGNITAGDGSSMQAETRFAVIDRHGITPQQPKGSFRMGINYHMDRYSPGDRRLTLDALTACGAKLVRASIGCKMAAVQPNGPDEWKFDVADENLDLLEKHGLSLDAGAFGIPRWAAIPGNRTNEDWRVWALGRPEQNVYEKFCERLAERYGKRIDYYEIGNEWDLGFKGTIDDAVEIQRMSYLGLKRSNPNVCVIPNGWAAPGDNPQVVRSGHAGFHEAFLRRAGEWFDVHPIHIHGGFADYAAQIEGKFFPLRERTGVSGKPWYSNETSMTSLWDERSVAYLVWKKVLWAWSRGSVDYIWYNLRGTGWDPKDPEQWYGLVSADYKPRDSYVAFAALSKTFGGKRFRREAFHLASRYVMEFAGENDITLGAWDETAGGLVAVRVGTDARKAWHVDVMGNRTSVPVENGHATFSFGAAPAALVLDGATFADLDMKALADIPPPKAKPVSIPADSPGRKPDFVMDSHGQVHDFYEANPAETGRLWKGPQDLSAKAWLSCCKKGLRLRVEVVDDVHSQSYPDGDQYMGDDVQVALASHLQQGHWEFGLARRDDGTSSVACWLGPAGFDASKAASRVELATKREGSITSYDACIPYEAVGFGPELPYQGFRFNLLVNDNDGDGRDAFIELKRGNFSTKDASAYPFVRISR